MKRAHKEPLHCFEYDQTPWVRPLRSCLKLPFAGLSRGGPQFPDSRQGCWFCWGYFIGVWEKPRLAPLLAAICIRRSFQVLPAPDVTAPWVMQPPPLQGDHVWIEDVYISHKCSPLMWWHICNKDFSYKALPQYVMELNRILIYENLGFVIDFKDPPCYLWYGACLTGRVEWCFLGLGAQNTRVWTVSASKEWTDEQARVTPNRSALYGPQFRDEKETCCGLKSLSLRPAALTSPGGHVIRAHINFWSGESKERPGM